MGNSPGGLSEYQRLFEAYPRCQGGFVWEWIDHGIRQRTGDGREFFAYGGDFGEEVHDANFVADGLVFPDRTPSPGLVEYKKVIEPVRIHIDPVAGVVSVRNLYDFVDTDHLRFRWRLDGGDGDLCAHGELDVARTVAGGNVTVGLPVAARQAGWLTVSAVLADDVAWARA